MRRAMILTLALCSALSGQSPSDEASATKSIDSGLLSGLPLRSIGPALMSGRIADIAIDREHPNTWYVAAGSGNVWKTVNAGTTWTPIFDDYGSYSIGCIMIDPQRSNTVWVGTGEAVGGRHVGFGDGIYVSHDAGKSFRNMGLGRSEHIAKIAVHPHDSRIVYVAAQGPLWSPGGERGLYKSTDGGQQWRAVLTAGPYTGVTDVIIDSRDPDTIYAATHQHHRTIAALINGGPESGIHKSTDGGLTWTRLGGGLPGGDVGKIALVQSPQQPDVLYATIELPGRKGGLWRSSDSGASWTKMSDYVGGGTGPHYYQELWADPHRFDCLYQANFQLGRSGDGGKTWDNLSTGTKHVDNHAVAFHPTDPDFLLVGCDGGLYRSFDRGKTYEFFPNLPVTQFYKVDVDYDWPVYHVVGGTQDNATQYGPVRTLKQSGIRNADWRVTIGGDGHDCAIEPNDANIIYCESQEGYLQRFDRLTGESVAIRPQPGAGEDELRFNWDSPIHLSPHSATRIYYGSTKLHRSDDRGDSWITISGDLTRNLDRMTLEIMGRVWSIDATWDLFAMSQFGTITTISESPVLEGLIYVGTDDGLIQVTEDGGKEWRRIERIYGIPERAFVNDIKADRYDADTVYACLDNHKTGDYHPYLIKSTDRGHTWTSIVGDLPDRHLVWRIEQDHVSPSLLFLGTEFGLFTSLDGGQKWLELTAGVPTIPFRDIAIQRRENDLVGATFGRGFFVFDDYTPLRELSSATLEQDFALFPIRQALEYVQDDELGGTKGSQGDQYYAAPNPPYGAMITYYLKESMKSKKATRQEKESKLAKSGAGTPYPGWDQLKIEEREETPTLVFEIRDSDGHVVDRISGPNSAGIHRISWNLRYAPFTANGWLGPFVAPGTYTVQAYRRAEDQTFAMGAARTFDVSRPTEPAIPRQDPAIVLEQQRRIGDLQRSVEAAVRTVDDALASIQEIKRLIQGGRKVEFGLLDTTRALELELLDAKERLSGDPIKSKYSAVSKMSIQSRLGSLTWGTMGNTYGLTGTQRQQIDIARSDYESALRTIRSLLDDDLQALYAKLDAVGAPWTKGRKIPALRGEF